MTRNSAKRQLIHENIVLAKVMKLTDLARKCNEPFGQPLGILMKLHRL